MPSYTIWPCLCVVSSLWCQCSIAYLYLVFCWSWSYPFNLFLDSPLVMADPHFNSIEEKRIVDRWGSSQVQVQELADWCEGWYRVKGWFCVSSNHSSLEAPSAFNQSPLCHQACYAAFYVLTGFDHTHLHRDCPFHKNYSIYEISWFWLWQGIISYCLVDWVKSRLAFIIFKLIRSSLFFSMQLEVHYFHHHVTFTTAVSLKQAPTVDFSATVGTPSIAFGAEAGYDTTSSTFTKYTAGVSVSKPDSCASVIL